MFTITIDDSRMRQRLGELHDALIGAGKQGDAAIMVENEARLFLKQVINLTPPPGLGTAARKQGETAVARDMSKLFTPVNEEFLNIIGSQFGASGIDKWITNAEGKKEHLRWDKIDPTGQGMEAFHNRNRDGRGRARTIKRSGWDWYSPYVVSKATFDAYLAKIISHVGRRKAAWAISYKPIGGKVQRWIEKHISGAKGNVLNDLGNVSGHPSITMSNHSAGIGQDEHMFRSALRIRYEAIGRKMQRILRGYAIDMKYGRPIKPQEERAINE